MLANFSFEREVFLHYFNMLSLILLASVVSDEKRGHLNKCSSVCGVQFSLAAFKTLHLFVCSLIVVHLKAMAFLSVYSVSIS